jgi:ACS family hexuronate transporter-like MFS transporter
MWSAVSLWSLASVSHAFSGGMFGLLAARIGLGAGEAATYPAVVRTAVHTLPKTARMRGVGIGYGGTAIGALLAPLLITPVAAAWGWRTGFWFTGIAGILWLALWTGISRHPGLGRPTAAIKPAFAPR